MTLFHYKRQLPFCQCLKERKFFCFNKKELDKQSHTWRMEHLPAILLLLSAQARPPSDIIFDCKCHKFFVFYHPILKYNSGPPFCRSHTFSRSPDVVPTLRSKRWHSAVFHTDSRPCLASAPTSLGDIPHWMSWPIRRHPLRYTSPVGSYGIRSSCPVQTTR